MSNLNSRLLAAHSIDDKTSLVTLYSQAADQAKTADARAFYLTQAHIYALDIGHPDTAGLRDRLIDMGRESPL